MKKHYEAPEIYFDDFSLSTSIAGSCTYIVNNASKYTCAYHDVRQDKYVFTADIGACITKNEGEYNGICYHNPYDTTDLFNS